MGFISPFTIRGQLFLQQIWCVKGQSLDAPVPDEIEVAFVEWDVEQVNTPDITLERCVFR